MPGHSDRSRLHVSLHGFQLLIEYSVSDHGVGRVWKVRVLLLGSLGCVPRHRKFALYCFSAQDRILKKVYGAWCHDELSLGTLIHHSCHA